ncbi:MAG: c-type cytochrome [Gallionella sp.]|nr:c-type cytochrome [Gallionella sp.]
MKKQTLIVIASLALLSGCGGKSKEVAVPATATPGMAAAPKPLSASQPNEVKPQTVAAAPDLATGEKVYKGTCSICHKSGLKGAPRLGKKQDWEARLAQGNEVLYDRAINGYIGKKGSMPSRGSNARLSEDEVKAAVDYMVVHAIPSWEWGN